MVLDDDAARYCVCRARMWSQRQNGRIFLLFLSSPEYWILMEEKKNFEGENNGKLKKKKKNI